MTDARWTRIETLFNLAVDRSPDEQRAWLDRECGDDAELRDAVLALLAHARDGDVPITAVIAGAARLVAGQAGGPPMAPARCGPYRILREIGRGGMGTVFEAVRDDGTFSKRVALKVATRAPYASEFLRRFHDERQILARLEHPHIARLLDGGAADGGVPYFAMELVDGVPIDRYVEQHGLGMAERLRLFLQICEAVDYAHQNLVIHRDLTPRNILVAGGSVRLLDFGISKLLDAPDGSMTAAGLVPFTPDYGSPEQVRGDAVTTRTDVHALGLVLYELLTGSRAQRVEGTSPAAFARAICDTPVAAPSATAAARGDRVGARRLRGDLDTIVAVATERDPARRYASVAALADDIRRHLESRPIQARQASAWYRGTRFARRHWRPLTAAAVLIATLAAGIVATRLQARRAERRFDEVRRLANTVMNDVHAAIRDLPASAKAQEIVVATAVSYLEGLAREAGGDRSLRVEIGQGYTKVAELAFSRSRPSLGRPEAAQQYLDRARAVLEPLHAADPRDRPTATAMVRLHTAFGNFLDDTGRRTEALHAMEEAVRVGERARSIHASDPLVLEALVEAYGHLFSRFESSPAAQQLLRPYLERARALVAVAPTPHSRPALAVAYSQAGKVAASAGRVDESLDYFRDAAKIQAEIVAAEPFNATARRNLMLAWNNLSDLALGPLGLSSYTGPGGPPADLDPRRRQQALEAATSAIEQAAWLRQNAAQDPAATFDYAIALGRSAPAYPPGDQRAVTALDGALALLAGLETTYPDRTRHFLIEFSGSLAERHRQAGHVREADEAWRAADVAFERARAAAPDAFYPKRLFIPILQNEAATRATRGERAAASRVARRAVALADEVGAQAAHYARAPGWPPRVRTWAAALLASLGEDAAAARVRAQARAMWADMAARPGLPDDVTAEARSALAR
jgi:eukaryotic-like serine/threonine-protein kinase